MGIDHYPERVKVRFLLEVDDDGWPPAESEGLWAEPLGDDIFRIDNTPWFVRNLAAGDLVRATVGRDGLLWFSDRVEWSGRCTIRVIPRASGQLQGSRQAVLDAFSPLGVAGEGIEQYGMVALDVPSEADLQSVKALLMAGENDGRWFFEEGCVSSEWLAL